MGLPLAILVVTALVVQTFVRYWGQTAELSWSGFFWATAAARIVLPLACARFALGLSWRSLGLGWPRIPAREAWVVLALGALVTALAVGLLGMESYQSAYAGLRSGSDGTRLLRWVLFVASTTLPWEILHRAFLLHGTRELCARGAVQARDAVAIAVLLTLCFEVLFHLIKPPLEAIALLLGSPVLSLIALRYRSIWPSALGHVWIELLWFLTVWR